MSAGDTPSSVEHIDRGNVVDNQRTAFGGNPARRRPSPSGTRSDGTVLVAVDGAEIEHLAILLEEEDGGEIGIERAPQTRQQLLQQLVEGQVSQRAVGDALDGAKRSSVPSASALARLSLSSSRSRSTSARLRSVMSIPNPMTEPSESRKRAHETSMTLPSRVRGRKSTHCRSAR